MEEKQDLQNCGVLKGDEVPSAYRVVPRAENIIHFGDSVAAPEAVAVAAETPVSTDGKKKRGRPRKYGADGALALSPMPISASIPLTGGGDFSNWNNNSKGKPVGSYKKKHKLEFESPPGERVSYSAGANFVPHIITVNAGEDVSMKIMSFSQHGSRAICVLAANGAISNVTLLQPNTSGGTLTYEGRFELLSLSGSFMPTDTAGTKSRTGGMSVSLAGPDGRVLGGGLAGLLVAAGPVQVVIGSFLYGYQPEQKPKKKRSEMVPGLSPAVAANPIFASGTDAVYTGPMRSITPPSYHINNASAGNYVNGQTIAAAENSISFPREGNTVVAAVNDASVPREGQTGVTVENNTSIPRESEKLGRSENMVSS